MLQGLAMNRNLNRPLLDGQAKISAAAPLQLKGFR
jgi:hypothetical protein